MSASTPAITSAIGPSPQSPEVGVDEVLAVALRAARVAGIDADARRDQALPLPERRPAVERGRPAVDLDHQRRRPAVLSRGPPGTSPGCGGRPPRASAPGVRRARHPPRPPPSTRSPGAARPGRRDRRPGAGDVQHDHVRRAPSPPWQRGRRGAGRHAAPGAAVSRDRTCSALGQPLHPTVRAVDPPQLVAALDGAPRRPASSPSALQIGLETANPSRSLLTTAVSSRSDAAVRFRPGSSLAGREQPQVRARGGADRHPVTERRDRRSRPDSTPGARRSGRRGRP